MLISLVVWLNMLILRAADRQLGRFRLDGTVPDGTVRAPTQHMYVRRPGVVLHELVPALRLFLCERSTANTCAEVVLVGVCRSR